MTAPQAGTRFLAARETDSPAAVLLGAPLDETESFRSGTGAGPDRVRVVSEVLETYSPEAGRDLTDVPLADWGNLPCPQGDLEAALRTVAEAVERAARSALPVVVGGEHTATLGALRGLLRLYPELFVVQLDAHLDLRDSYQGRTLSHATVMRRVVEEIGPDRLVQLGVRSGTREEFALASKCLQSTRGLELGDATRRRIGARPVYLTIDIDVLDPAAAPGTGCPEPGGPTFRELLAGLYSMRALRVVGIDIMETLPEADVNDITSIAAAKLVRESVLLFADPD